MVKGQDDSTQTPLEARGGVFVHFATDDAQGTLMGRSLGIVAV